MGTITLLLAYAASQAAAQAPQYVQEMRQVAADASVARAMDVVEALEPRTQADLVTLTEIPAPPFGEEARAEHFAALLLEAGADSVVIDEVGNVIAFRAGSVGDRTVALAGHLDTVFPPETDVSVTVRGDTLFAPGVGDDTRGLVVVLTVLRAMNAADVTTDADLLFIGTVGEEGLGDLRGVKHLFRDGGPRIDAWIAVDGGGLDRVLHRGLGSRRYRVTFHGPGGHSWGAFGLGNPAHALARAVRAFDDAAHAFVADGPRTSYNVGRLGGGTSVNSIPFAVWMEVDMRSERPERLAGIDEIFRRAMEGAVAEENAMRRHGDPVTVDIALIGDRPSGEVDPATPLVQRTMAATTHLGEEPNLTIASTDSNIPIALGVPAVTIGRGGAGGGGHSLDEWWLNDRGHLAIHKALLVVAAEAGLAGAVP